MGSPWSSVQDVQVFQELPSFREHSYADYLSLVYHCMMDPESIQDIIYVLCSTLIQKMIQFILKIFWGTDEDHYHLIDILKIYQQVILTFF